MPCRPRPSGIGRRSARGFLWGTLAWTGNRLAILGLTLLLARLLTPEDFGIVTAALTLIAILDAALDLGVGAAVIAEQETGVSPPDANGVHPQPGDRRAGLHHRRRLRAA